jgi:antibiotic biosynthesis monooxygenase (ABM) superfamily enzyme
MTMTVSTHTPRMQPIQVQRAQSQPTPTPLQPTRWKLALVLWMMVYPMITGLGLALNPVLKDRPLLVKNLVLTAIFVPLMVYGVVPVARKAVIKLDATQKN